MNPSCTTTISPELELIRKECLEAAKAASAHVLYRQQNGFEEFEKINHNGETEKYTNADVESQEIVVTQLGAKFPRIPILAEEGDKHTFSGDEFFTIDPIDGTYPFADHLKDFGCLIGYVRSGIPSAGAMSLPALALDFSTAEGFGCTLNGEAISPDAELGPGVSISSGPWSPPWFNEELVPALERAGFPVQTAKAACTGVAAMLKGETHTYIALGDKIWDVLPGAAAARALGGVTLSSTGAEMTWNQLNTPCVITRRPELGRKALAIAAPVLERIVKPSG